MASDGFVNREERLAEREAALTQPMEQRRSVIRETPKPLVYAVEGSG